MKTMKIIVLMKINGEDSNNNFDTYTNYNNCYTYANYNDNR